MGWKKKVRKFAGKIISKFMGETSSQKANKALKMFGINIFSKIIICGKLPKIPDNQVYFLSLAEMDRLKSIFSRYNYDAAQIKDSVLSPVIQQQIASNETIMEYFEEIEAAINKVPAERSDNFSETHKNCLEAVTKMIEYMYGLRAKLNSKVGQNSLKECVDEYLGGVLKAKPSGGVYWEEFLVWLSKIIDPNLAHLGELKTMLLKAKLPDGYKKIQKNEKNKEDKNQEKSFQIIEKVRAELVAEYGNKVKDNGNLGQVFADILNGKFKEKIVKKIGNQFEMVGEQILAKKVALPEIKLMNKLSSKKIKFMGFKLAARIKIQLESYRDSMIKHEGLIIYETQNEIIEKVVPILTNYINLKNKEIKTELMKSPDYDSASSFLENIKSSMNKCFLDLQEALKKYKNKDPIGNIQDLYLENAQGVDAKELERFFRVMNDKKLMFFEEYVHELYVISGNSNKILDKVIVPKSLYIDTDALQIDSAKFSIKDKKWKTFNSKDISKCIDQKFKLELERIEKEINVNDSDISKLETDCNDIKQEWDECHEKLDGFCEEYKDVIENEKAKNNLKSIAKEIEDLSKNIKLNIPEYRKKAEKLKSDIRKSDSNQKTKSFSKDAIDLKAEKCNLEKLKSKLESKVKEYTKIDKNIRNDLKNKKAKSEKQVKTLSDDFDKIINSIGELSDTIQQEHKALGALREDVEAEKSKAYETYKNDKEKKEKLEKTYDSFIKAEKELLDSLNADGMEAVKYWFEEVPEEWKKGFQKILDEKSEVFDKEKKCRNMLKKVKLIKEQQCDLLFQDVRKKIEEISKLYTTTKTALSSVGSQSWLEWFASWFGYN